MSSHESMKTRLGDADATKIFFTDLNGRLKSLSINPASIGTVLEEGVGIDGSSIAGIATVDSSDRVLKPVAESFRLVQFADKKVGFFTGKLYDQDGSRASVDPRLALENAVEKAANTRHIKFCMGPEHEFFILRSDDVDVDIHTDRLDYFGASPSDVGDTVRQEIVDVLATCGVQYEKTHHEVTSSQHEVNLEPGDPLTVADRTLLFNFVAKEVAARHGLHVTFMAKPFTGFNRNAFHIHASILDMDGNNLCYDADAEHTLSPLVMQFIGGICKYAREGSIVFASTVNSYKAYVLDKEVPFVRGWGLRNRSSMVRIPYAVTPAATRLELRCPDPAGNVYLQFAVLIEMGLAGLDEELDPGAPDRGDVSKRIRRAKVMDKRLLPLDFALALVESQNSRFLEAALGEDLYRSYVVLKTEEWEEHRTTITDLEHRKYLGV